MARLRIESDSKDAEKYFERLRAGMTPAKQDGVVRRVAWVVHRRLVQQTPKRWTGQTRRSWKVTRRGTAKYSVWNSSKVMLFLERGTKAHGPRRARFLFVPLTRKAALAGARTVLNSAGFTPGKDYVLAKRVRGIKAMRIVENYRPFAALALKAAMRIHIQKVLAGQ